MIKIPEWLARLPKGASIDKKEFAQLLAVSPGTLQNRVDKWVYSMPKPDFNSRVSREDKLGRTPLMRGIPRGKGKNHWKAVTVRNYIRHLNRLEAEGKL